jgi:hypothetical protein
LYASLAILHSVSGILAELKSDFPNGFRGRRHVLASRLPGTSENFTGNENVLFS